MYYTDPFGLSLLYSFLYRLPSFLMQQSDFLAIDWAGHAFTPSIQDVGVDHRSFYILVPE